MRAMLSVILASTVITTQAFAVGPPAPPCPTFVTVNTTITKSLNPTGFNFLEDIKRRDCVNGDIVSCAELAEAFCGAVEVSNAVFNSNTHNNFKQLCDQCGGITNIVNGVPVNQSMIVTNNENVWQMSGQCVSIIECNKNIDNANGITD